MTRFTPAILVSAVLFGYLAGQATSTRDRVGAEAAPAQQPPPPQAPAWTTIPLAPDQGELTYWSSDDLKRAHTEMAARSGGRIVSKPRDLVPVPIMRTHMLDVVHRPQLAAGQTPTAEQHEGVTDLYVIIGGSGTLVVGGTIENRQPIANRPGEYTGRPILGGRTLKVKTGDVVNVPPNLPHASEGDAGGLTYMLVKVNVGLYPWGLVSGAQ